MEQYLILQKLKKHCLFLSFIENIAKMGFPREAHKMLTISVAPQLTHILKSVPKNPTSIEWMKSADEAHVSTWLSCSVAETLDATHSPSERTHLASSLDFPP